MNAPILIPSPNDWQRPARTEEWGASQFTNLSVKSPFFQFLGFPWATLIDLKRRGYDNRADSLKYEALTMGPKRTLIRATLCQHIWAEDLQPLFMKLGITDLFWPHKTINEQHLGEIRLHPFPLFPVRAFKDLKPRSDLPSQHHRNILFNFIGAYDPQGYLTPVRKWILDLPQASNCVIKQRDQWHYEHAVYDCQIDNKLSRRSEHLQQSSNELEYDNILSQSLFTLCPSGTGPNSIRLWEAIMFGSIPVLLSDNLDLPGPKDMWKDAILRLSETSETIKNLPSRLAQFAENKDRIDAYQRNLAKLKDIYLLKSVENLILPLSETEYISNVMRAK